MHECRQFGVQSITFAFFISSFAFSSVSGAVTTYFATTKIGFICCYNFFQEYKLVLILLILHIEGILVVTTFSDVQDSQSRYNQNTDI